MMPDTVLKTDLSSMQTEKKIREAKQKNATFQNGYHWMTERFLKNLL